MPGHDVICVGASAGGVGALVKLVQALPADIPAAFFVVLHIPPESHSMLPEILSRSGKIPATHPEDSTPIEYGHIYVAPPDHHLILEKGYVRIIRGPKENRHRPAIDVLFRSAAATYGTRAVGVVLTGALDDGTAGLLAIKRCGGIAVVQDPNDAAYPDMPRSAIANVAVDYIVPLATIGSKIVNLAYTEVDETMEHSVPKDIQNEVAQAKMELSRQKDDVRVGTPSQYSCPECGGVLWKYKMAKYYVFVVVSVMRSQ